MESLNVVTYPWIGSRVSKAPAKFWADPSNHKQYIRWLESRLGIKELADWYNVKPRTVQAQPLSVCLLSKYNGSIRLALQAVYPEFKWQPWRFERCSPSYWDDFAKHVEFFEWLGKTLQFSSIQDWYKVTRKDIQQHGGLSLLSLHYNNSPLSALQKIYPQQQWQPWRFEIVAEGFWTTTNQRTYFDWLAEEMDIKVPEDWYQMKQMDLSRHHGNTILKCHRGSYTAALMHVFPDTGWQPWLFTGTWNLWNPSTQEQFIRWMEDKFDINCPNDWYKVSNRQVVDHGGQQLLLHHGGLLKLLANVYPDHNWSRETFNTMNGIKAQTRLGEIIRSLFPADLDVNLGYHSKLMHYENTHREMELDIWIPKFNLAFEFQGEQHYHLRAFSGDNFKEAMLAKLIVKDTEKQEAAQSVDITLITIACWWNCNVSSLVATILQFCPAAREYLPQTPANPIEQHRTKNFYAKRRP